MSARSYNADFAWRNGFGGGLACEHEPGLFAGLDPGSLAFVEATSAFQLTAGLVDDGYFGPATFAEYLATHGKPSLQVLGYDVSYCQKARKLSHQKMRDAGFVFFWAKASEGRTIQDARAREHVEAGVRAGSDFGFYHFHFFTLEDHARAQAEHFVRCVEPLPEASLRPVLDLEHKGYKLRDDGSIKYGRPEFEAYKRDRSGYRERMTSQMLAWCERIEELLGVPPLVYSYPSFLRDRVHRVAPGWYERHQLWLSSRRLSQPHEVPGWTLRQTVCQQSTSQGTDETRAIYDKQLVVNRAPWGLAELRAVRN